MLKEKYIIRWKVCKHRRDKCSGALSTIGKTLYMKAWRKGRGLKVNKKQIENSLRDYNWMINEIKRQRDLLEDAGTNLVPQTGIESPLPKPQGETGDPIPQEVVRRDKRYTWIDKLEKKVLFIQKHMSKVEDEREKAVLECLLDGMSMVAIGNHMGLSSRHIRRIKDSIVSQMSDMSAMSCMSV